MKEFIEKKLMTLKPLSLNVIDNSVQHYGHIHNNGGGHFNIQIVADHFTNMPLVNRHQEIYKLFKEELNNNKIHALSIDAKSPSE